MRRITQPHSKLNRLCEEAAARGGNLTTFAAVAKAIDLTPSRVTQMFGYGQEAKGTIVRPETAGRLIAAFYADGVACEVAWLYLDFPDFAKRITGSGPSTSSPRRTGSDSTRATDWELTEATVLPDLVELRLHPPRAGNEMADSHYVDATLLFGTAQCDYEPDDPGQPPRSIAIGLRNARLAIGSDSYRPLPGTMLGEREASDHLLRVAGGLEIIGPAPGGTLDGDPLGGQHLAVIAGTNTGEAPFTVTVAANRRSFVVADLDATPPPGDAAVPTNKDAILSALIYRHAGKDEAGRAVLARATMRHRPAETDLPS